MNIIVFGIFFIGINTAIIALDRKGYSSGGYGFGYWTAILMFILAIIIKFAEKYRKDVDVSFFSFHISDNKVFMNHDNE